MYHVPKAILLILFLAHWLTPSSALLRWQGAAAQTCAYKGTVLIRCWQGLGGGRARLDCRRDGADGCGGEADSGRRVYRGARWRCVPRRTARGGADAGGAEVGASPFDADTATRPCGGLHQALVGVPAFALDSASKIPPHEKINDRPKGKYPACKEAEESRAVKGREPSRGYAEHRGCSEQGVARGKEGKPGGSRDNLALEEVPGQRAKQDVEEGAHRR